MKLPELKKPDKYVGLYIFDFGDHAAVGFTAQEVAELLESEKYKHGKVYRIHRAHPDGRLELKGVPNEIFELEAGMFFYSQDRGSAERDYKALIDLAVRSAPPCRAKLHLAQYDDDKFAVAFIYPAEYDDDVSSWLIEADYKTAGAAEAGTGAVQRYYDAGVEILERHQLFAQTDDLSRTGDELLSSLKLTVQR
jgi:hypothetical protein